MTLIEKYSISYYPRASKTVHFELVIDDENIPLHLSLRPKENVIAINNRVAGEWSREIRLAYPLQEVLAPIPLMIDVRADHAIIRINCMGLILPLHKDHARGPRAWSPRSHMAWSTVPSDTPLHSAKSEAEPEKAKAFIDLHGRTIWLPTDAVAMSKQTQTLLQAASRSGPNCALLHFLGSRSFPGDLQVLDLHRDGGFSALLHAALNPRARVVHLEEEAQDPDFLNELAAQNGLDNLVTLSFSPEALETWLKALDGASDLLLQGEEVLARLGTRLSALPAAQRARVHLYSDEPEVVPGNTVFDLCGSGATNIRLRAGKWEMQHCVTPGARPPGLDVVVAAYNVKDYVVDCVSSLLCAGRDDIHVIVVNDGSTDGTDRIVTETFADDPRVTLSSKPNGGCASARNYGRLLSERAHVTFVDADDLVSPGFFADLYDLALYTGAEVVQGSFDFYDVTRPEPFYPSYEDALFAARPRTGFAGKDVFELATAEIIKGQPTIWRKVYRRDFLDARKIWFPENVRAYDDYIFHILSLTATPSIWMMPEQKYHYRQHPAQDIKAGDERHFYMLHMFQTLLARSVDEGWHNFLPYAESIMDSINWSAGKLRPDLVDSFLTSAARFCVSVQKVYGPDMMSPRLIAVVRHPDFPFHFRRESEALKHLMSGPHWAYFSGPIGHPDSLRMRQTLLQSQ